MTTETNTTFEDTFIAEYIDEVGKYQLTLLGANVSEDKNSKPGVALIFASEEDGKGTGGWMSISSSKVKSLQRQAFKMGTSYREAVQLGGQMREAMKGIERVFDPALDYEVDEITPATMNLYKQVAELLVETLRKNSVGKTMSVEVDCYVDDEGERRCSIVFGRRQDNGKWDNSIEPTVIAS